MIKPKHVLFVVEDVYQYVQRTLRDKGAMNRDVGEAFESYIQTCIENVCFRMAESGKDDKDDNTKYLKKAGGYDV